MDFERALRTEVSASNDYTVIVTPIYQGWTPTLETSQSALKQPESPTVCGGVDLKLPAEAYVSSLSDRLALGISVFVREAVRLRISLVYRLSPRTYYTILVGWLRTMMTEWSLALDVF